jgi:hypothetical protein
MFFIKITQLRNSKFYWFNILHYLISCSRFQLPGDLRRGPADARLLRFWIRNATGAWMFFSSECCVLSGSGLRVELITHPELESTLSDMHEVSRNGDGHISP